MTTARRASSSREQEPQRVEDHPLGRLDPAEHDHGRVRDGLVLGQRAAMSRRRAPPPTSASAAIAAAPPGVGSCPVAIPDTEATISRYQPSSWATLASSRPSRPSVSATTAAASGPASSARSSAVDARPPSASTQARRLRGHERAERRRHLARAERRPERLAVPGVRRPVGRQHARPDDAGGREAWVVDRERRRVAEHVDGDVAGGHEPAAEGVDERHRPGGAQRREVRVRIAAELLDRRRHANDLRAITPS